MKKINIKNKKVLLIITGIVVGILLFIFITEFISKNNYSTIDTKIKTDLIKANQLELVDYEHPNFNMKIPEGWVVDADGDNMYFSLRVYDPNDDRYQIYSILKAEPLLKNEKAKAWYENYYHLFGGVGNKMLAKAIVVPEGTVESFYSNFNSYVNYAKEIGSTFKAPDLKNFVAIESFDNNSELKSVAKDDKILRGTFQDTETSQNGEGLFMATIVDVGSDYTLGYDTLYYVAYNVMGITTGEYDLINYQNLLVKSLNSLTYKDSFVNSTIQNGQEQTKNALALNASIQQAYESYNSAWNARQKTYDITRQKYSDATLGYERVYDTNTGEIYKAYNGFIDDYSGSRYKSVTDDMYSESITGYIEK